MTPLLAQRSRADRAFERLYQRHVGAVYRYALVVLRNPADAEDVTQTTFMNAYRAFARGERPRMAQSWLIAIAHNVCRQRFRQAQRRPNETPLDEELFATPPEPNDDAPRADDIRRALGHLAFNQRAALVMRELEGRSYVEIAEVLELSTSAVETLIFRARRALREQLEGGLTCHEAELAVSRQLDSRLERKEKGQLRAHLRECGDCARFARSQRAQRSAIKALAAIPIPTSLTHFFGHGGVAAAAGATAGSGAGVGAGVVVGGGVLAKVALVGATAIVAGGVGVEAARKANWHPLREQQQTAAAGRASHRTAATPSQTAHPRLSSDGRLLVPRVGHPSADQTVHLRPVEKMPGVKGARLDQQQAANKRPPLFPPSQSGPVPRIETSKGAGPQRKNFRLTPRKPGQRIESKPARGVMSKPAQRIESKPTKDVKSRATHRSRARAAPVDQPPIGSPSAKLQPPSPPRRNDHGAHPQPPPPATIPAPPKKK